jgi:hypothetical protein
MLFALKADPGATLFARIPRRLAHLIVQNEHFGSAFLISFRDSPNFLIDKSECNLRGGSYPALNSSHEIPSSKAPRMFSYPWEILNENDDPIDYYKVWSDFDSSDHDGICSLF